METPPYWPLSGLAYYTYYTLTNGTRNAVHRGKDPMILIPVELHRTTVSYYRLTRALSTHLLVSSLSTQPIRIKDSCIITVLNNYYHTDSGSIILLQQLGSIRSSFGHQEWPHLCLLDRKAPYCTCIDMSTRHNS